MIENQESVTAKLCSFARAYHSSFEHDRIFDDGLAFDMMGLDEFESMGLLIQHGFKFSRENAHYGFNRSVVTPVLTRCIMPIPISRIAFTEKELASFIEKNPACQYVICGAGMDSFSFRNTHRNVRVFEIDHPDTQRYKKEKIRRLEWIVPENVSFVPVDFSKDDMAENLIKNGFDPDLPSFFALPGVLYYLTSSVFEETLKKISSVSAAHTEIVFDFPDETTFLPDVSARIKELRLITEKLGEKMRHGYSTAEINAVLRKSGFAPVVHKTPEDIQKTYFSNRTDGLSAFENVHFVKAERRKHDEKNSKFYGQPR